MNTLNIALRPNTFEEMIGNASAVAAVQREIASGKVPLAWLFSGETGVGKTTLAKIVARTIQGPLTEQEAAQLSIVETNASNTNGVEDMREMVRTSAYRPMAGRYKVVILDEAHGLTEAAQKVLLTPLEDGKSTTVWIFCTTEPAKLLPALRRRCFHQPLRPLSSRDAEALVRRACVPFDPAILEQVQAAKLSSPGEIVMAVEKFQAGVAADEAVLGIEHEPLYSDVARAVLDGDWEECRSLMAEIRSPDIRALRSVVAAFLKGALLKRPRGPRAMTLSGALKALINSTAWEDGIVAAGTVGVLYEACEAIRTVDREVD